MSSIYIFRNDKQNKNIKIIAISLKKAMQELQKQEGSVYKFQLICATSLG
jgi:hypothetical protein